MQDGVWTWHWAGSVCFAVCCLLSTAVACIWHRFLGLHMSDNMQGVPTQPSWQEGASAEEGHSTIPHQRSRHGRWPDPIPEKKKA